MLMVRPEWIANNLIQLIVGLALFLSPLAVAEPPCAYQLSAHDKALARVQRRIIKFAPKLAAKLDFQMMALPTVKEARARKQLPSEFLDSVEGNTLDGDLSLVIPFKARNANRFVTVYRIVNYEGDLSDFDPGLHYRRRTLLYGNKWTGDFVTDKLPWVWVYGGGRGQDLLIKYKVPAMLLDIDMTTHRQEPYYVISKQKMKAAGFSHVALFIENIARVEPYRFTEYDPDFDLETTHEIQNPKFKWLTAKELSAIIERR